MQCAPHVPPGPQSQLQQARLLVAGIGRDGATEALGPREWGGGEGADQIEVYPSYDDRVVEDDVNVDHRHGDAYPCEARSNLGPHGNGPLVHGLAESDLQVEERDSNDEEHENVEQDEGNWGWGVRGEGGVREGGGVCEREGGGVRGKGGARGEGGVRKGRRGV